MKWGSVGGQHMFHGGDPIIAQMTRMILIMIMMISLIMISFVKEEFNSRSLDLLEPLPYRPSVRPSVRPFGLSWQAHFQVLIISQESREEGSQSCGGGGGDGGDGGSTGFGWMRGFARNWVACVEPTRPSNENYINQLTTSDTPRTIGHKHTNYYHYFRYLYHPQCYCSCCCWLGKDLPRAHQKPFILHVSSA